MIHSNGFYLTVVPFKNCDRSLTEAFTSLDPVEEDKVERGEALAVFIAVAVGAVQMRLE